MRTVEIVLDDKKDYFTREAFNTLRTNILFSGRDVKTILITSCIAHEGKSTISFETALNLAEAGKKVLLIDADLRKSVFANRYTKEKGLLGLSQYLSGQADRDDVLYETQIPNFSIIFSGPFPPNPTELVGNEAFGELIRSVRDSYDYVLVDVPPLGMVIDAAVMAPSCDGAVLVINTGVIKYRLAQRVADQLRKSGCRILGVVLNQASRKAGRNGKGKYYKSYYSYQGQSGAATTDANPKKEKKSAK